MTPSQAIAGHETEAGFTKAVLDLGALHGWHCFHARPARTAKGWRTAGQGNGAKGWPDLVMVKGKKLIAAELKVGKKNVTSEQREWLFNLNEAGVAVFVWRPEDWDRIVEILGAPGVEVRIESRAGQ